MAVQINGRRIIGAVTWKIGSTISRECSITGKSSSIGPDVGQYSLVVNISLQSLSEFNDVDVDSIISVSYTDSAIQSVKFNGLNITLFALVPDPRTSYTFAIQVTAAVSSPRLLQIPRISVPIDSGRKDCPFDIDHLSYTIDENSKTCTIKGLKEGDTTTKLYLPGKVIYRDSTTSKLMLTSSVTIYSKAFERHTELTSVTIGNGVTSIGNDAFYSCSGLTSVTISDSVTSIGDYAFSSCSGLTSVTIGNGVTTIGHRAFQNCSGLTNVTIPNSVTSIGERAFRDCIGLTSITIPDSVTSIKHSTFYDCIGLISVTIPDSVTSIGDYAFSSCSKLSEITFTGTMEQWKNINKGSGWDNSTGEYTVHCTDGDISKYS